MKLWVLYSVITLILWGVWGFLGKVASQGVPDRTLLLLGSLGFALTFPVVYFIFPKAIRFDVKSLPYYAALIRGLFAGIGVMFFYRALTLGNASRVVAFTAMYPLVTVVLSIFFLHESISVLNYMGIFFAIIAALLLSI